MKKFSNITGENLPKEIKVESNQNSEEETLKFEVLNLLDNFLSVRTYGPVDRYLRAGNIKISGKEMFLEALMDLLKEKTLKKETKILESLKSEIKDWEIIDLRIEEANKNIEKLTISKRFKTNKNKLKSLIESYSKDEETLLLRVDESCKKITNAETAYLNSLAAKSLSDENLQLKATLLKISDKFENKAQQLGYFNK